MRQVVIGIDSGTQSVKALVVDLQSGATVSIGRAQHTGETVQDPDMWWRAMVDAVREAVAAAGPVDVRAIAVDGQQHGLVALDAEKRPIMPAPLWNNTDSAPDADRLNAEADFAAETGTRLVASITITKLAHLARARPDLLTRLEAACLPHDFLTYRLTGNLVTDRGEASGSGWWSTITGDDRRDLLALAVGDEVAARLGLPEVLGPDSRAGELTASAAAELGLPTGIPVGAGSGDNPAAACGIGGEAGELVISLGTSGVAFVVADSPTADPSGEVCGFADATGHYLPLACMLNCTQVVDSMAAAVGMERFAALEAAGTIAPGANGLMLTPYLGGERTPNLPRSRGTLTGMTTANLTPAAMIRAAVDGVAAGIAYCVEALSRNGHVANRATLVGGGSVSPVWQQAIADATGLPIDVRSGTEHAARGMAAQAAAVALAQPTFDLSREWRPPVVATVEPRPQYRPAFRLNERREIIDAQRPG